MTKKLKQIKFQLPPKRRNVFCIPEGGTALDNAEATALDVARDTTADVARGMAQNVVEDNDLSWAGGYSLTCRLEHCLGGAHRVQLNTQFASEINSVIFSYQPCFGPPFSSSSESPFCRLFVGHYHQILKPSKTYVYLFLLLNPPSCTLLVVHYHEIPKLSKTYTIFPKLSGFGKRHFSFPKLP